MNLPKTLLIGGIATAVVAVGVITYFTLDKSSNMKSSEDSLLKDYQELLEQVKDPKTKANLSSSCGNTEQFANQLFLFENELNLLQKRKNDLFNKQESVPPLPDINEEDIIIVDDPRPGSEVPELSDDNYVPPLPDINEEDIIIVDDPRPGSEVPELSDDNYVPPLPDINEEYIIIVDDPRPGSEVPELSDDNYVPPLPDINEEDIIIITTLDRINVIEEDIILELNNLKSICEEEKNTEIISTSCVDACKKYYDCAGYTEGSTKEDQQDAYDGCFEECQKWSDETKICINKKPIYTVVDCTNFTICALAEYGTEVQ